jgi:adhesin HecA-like repeat protein
MRIKGSVKRSAVLALGCAILSFGQAADAATENGVSFRDFRNQNAGVDRHALRQMFKSERQSSIAERRLNAPAISGGAVNRVAGERRSANIDLNRQIRTPDIVRQSLQQVGQNRLVRLSSGVDLDLGSSNATVILGEGLFSKTDSVQIKVGNESKTFTAGSHVTPAEYVAIKQVLTGSGQNLEITGNGTASGGQVDLSALDSGRGITRASSLVVPVGVTAVGDFSRGSDFRLSGDLSNFGTVEALNDGRGKRAGSFYANNISNQAGALISSQGDLIIAASSNLSNDGSITSDGSVTLSAKNLTNSGTVSAVRDVNLSAEAITNTGAITSISSNVNIDNPTIANSGTFIIDNRGGNISALNGAINVRTPQYTGAQNTYLVGGNLLSSELNLNAGGGSADVDVEELTGMVNSTGTAAHVTADTSVLNLGTICLTGDPTFYNTTGAIAINGNITVAEALTIVADSDINFNNGSDLTAGDVTQGYPITLIAGAKITATAGGSDQTGLGPIPPANGNNGGVTINGGSTTGGSILFNSTANLGTTIFARSTGVLNVNGADVTLVAFQGTSPNSGRVNILFAGQDSILTGGKGVLGNNGSVTIIAPSQNNSGSSLPSIDTTGGSGAAGNITIALADPVANGTVYFANGSRDTSTAAIVPSATLSTIGRVNFQNVTAGNGSLAVVGRTIGMTGASNTVSARRIDLDASQSGGSISLLSNVVAGSLFSAIAQGAIHTSVGVNDGSLRSPVAILTSTLGVIGSSGDEFLITDGGTVFADAGAGVNIISGGGLAIAGGSVTAGNFVVQAAGNTSITGDISLGNGSVSISTTSGAFTVGDVNLSTSNGNITLANLGTNRKTSTLTLTGTDIKAFGAPALGDITLSVGAPTGTVAGRAPRKNVQVFTNGTGQIFFGKRGLTANAPTSVFQANDANIVINNALTTKNIVVSGVTLLAD